MLPIQAFRRMGERRASTLASPVAGPSRSQVSSFTRALLAGLAAMVLVACGTTGDGGAVTPPPPAQVHAVRVTPEAPTALVGDAVQLTATPVDSRGNTLDREVTWHSLAPQVATIDASGRAVGVAEGHATLVATSGSVSGNVQFTVQRRTVAALVLSTTEVILDPAQSHQVVAIVKDATGIELADRVVTWSSNDPQVATVDPTGRVASVAEGVTVIEATSEGVRAQLTVTVRPIPIARIVLSASHADMEPGDDVLIAARAEAADGSLLTGRLIYWGSSNPFVVKVEANGRLRAQMTGEVIVTVSSEGKEAQLTVKVHPRPANPLVFDRVSASGNEIFVQEYDGSFTRLNAGNVSRHASASPDGQRFVFSVTQRDFATNEMIHDLFMVDRNGMNIRHLTKMAGEEIEPVWSPDGSKIAFAASSTVGAPLDVFVVNIDGSGATNLTPDMTFSYERSPSWSLDGQMIAFASQDMFGYSHIYTMNADGSGRSRLTSVPNETASHPTWSPDGSKVAFYRWYQGTGADVVIMTRAGRAETRLAVAGDQIDPVWSPDGQHFAFTMRMGDDDHVGSMRVDGSAVRLRAKGRNPAWVSR